VDNKKATPAKVTPPLKLVRHRKNIEKLTAAELAALRTAFTKVYAINDERGYQYHAGIHGLPLPIWCQHGTPLFAIWHRPYLYFFEKALQDVAPGVTLPYWDWTTLQAQQTGMPKAYTDKTFMDGGSRRANPLLKSAIKFSGSQFNETSRDPGSTGVPKSLADLVTRAQRTSTGYVDYSRNLENPHNGLHGWVGGTMGLVTYAAYDPIFWAHHANIDRLFASWQAANPNVQPPASIANTVLQPFGVTVQQMWNIRDLGYDYVNTLQVASGAKAVAKSKFNTPVAEFSLEGVNLQPRQRNTRTAYIRLHEVKHPRDSFEIRVFLNQPKANAETPTEGNPNYAGSMYVFGHGECAGSEGHCEPEESVARDEFDIRPPHHLAPFTLQLDATEALQNVALTESASGAEPKVSVTLVAVDPKGNQIMDPGIDFEAVGLETV
jgi:tyrosinase